MSFDLENKILKNYVENSSLKTLSAMLDKNDVNFFFVRDNELIYKNKIVIIHFLRLDVCVFRHR